MIDAHIHYAASVGQDRLNTLIHEAHLEALALQCIPKGGTLPVEEDAFAFQAQCSVPVYIFGGLDRSVYDTASARSGISSLSEKDVYKRQLLPFSYRAIRSRGAADCRSHPHRWSYPVSSSP